MNETLLSITIEKGNKDCVNSISLFSLFEEDNNEKREIKTQYSIFQWRHYFDIFYVYLT